MRFTVKRSEATARRAPLTLAVGGMVLAAVGVMAASRLGALPLVMREGYAVRIVLPASRHAYPAGVHTAARKAPLAEQVEPDAGLAAAPISLATLPTLPVSTATRPVPHGRVPGVIALNYSLAGGANAGDAIEIEKAVTFDGVDAGRISLRIDGNAKVFALGSRLAAIIAAQSGQAAVPQGLEKDFVSLDALRALGIGVTYDATRDRLMVEAPGA